MYLDQELNQEPFGAQHAQPNHSGQAIVMLSLEVVPIYVPKMSLKFIIAKIFLRVLLLFLISLVLILAFKFYFSITTRNVLSAYFHISKLSSSAR